MFANWVQVRIINPVRCNIETHNSEQDDCLREFNREKLKQLQLNVIQLERERDAPLRETEMIHQIECEIRQLECSLADLTKRMRCSIDAGDQTFANAHGRCQQIVDTLSPELKKLLTFPLGQQYLDATWWVCNQHYPRFPNTHGSTKEQIEMLLSNVQCVLTKLERVTKEDVLKIKALGDSLVEKWTLRYAAVTKLFVDVETCNIGKAAKWPEFVEHTMPSDAIATELMLLAKNTNNSNSPCVAEALRQLYPLQRIDREFYTAANSALNCNGGRCQLLSCVSMVRELLSSCHTHLTEMKPMRECLKAPLLSLHSSGIAKEASSLEQVICERKDTLQHLKCMLTERHDHLAGEIACLNKSIAKLSAELRCLDDDDNGTRYSSLVRVNDNPRQTAVMAVSARCGVLLEVSLQITEPGLEYPFALTMFAHHEERIAQLRCECECVRVRQQSWISYSAHVTDSSPEALAALVGGLNQFELDELTRAIKRLRTDLALPEPSKLTTHLNGAVAQSMVCFWSKVLSNMNTQMTQLCREQDEGVVPHMDDSTRVQFENFDWSKQGLYTFRVVNELDGTSITEHVQLTVMPSTASQFSTWSDWSKLHMLNSYDVHSDLHMPDVGAVAAPHFGSAQPHNLDHLSDEQAGAMLMQHMREMGIRDVSTHFSSPNNFISWLSKQKGNPLRTSIAERIQTSRRVAAASVVNRMRKQGRSVDAQAIQQQLIDGENWIDFTNSYLSVGCHDDQVQQTACNPCAPVVSAEHEARHTAKMGRAVTAALLRKHPAFLLVYLTQCNYRNLMCMLDDRSTSMRWAVSEIAEVERAAIECNEWFTQHLRRIEHDLHIHQCVQDACTYGPVLSNWYASLNDAWATYALALGDMDAWIESITCTPDLSSSKPSSEAECAELKASVMSAYDKLAQVVLQTQSIPRCVPSAAMIAELKACTKSAATDPLAMWKCVVCSHEQLVLSFAKESPWVTVSATCQPLEWLKTALEIGARADVATRVALGSLTEAMYMKHLPALYAWLSFCVTTELVGFGRSQCGIELLREQRLQSGLCEQVEKEDTRLRRMFDAARVGQEVVASYSALIDPLQAVHTAVKQAMPVQKEIRDLLAFMSLLDERYRTEDLAEWRGRLMRQPAEMLARDTVTPGMGAYAAHWETDPMSDSIVLETLAKSALLKPSMGNHLSGLLDWATIVRRQIQPSIAGDSIALTNHEIILRDLGNIRVIDVAKRFKKDSPAPTMASLMCRYRDLMWVVDNHEGRLMQASNAYFATELMLATLYYVLATELRMQLDLIVHDLLDNVLCVGAKQHVVLWDESTGSAVCELLEEVPCALRTFEDPNSHYPSIWATVLREYEGELIREVDYERQLERAVRQTQPWLEPAEVVLTEQRIHLADMARSVFGIHLDLKAKHAFVGEMIDQYVAMMHWLDSHFVHLSEPGEMCLLSSGFSLPAHEYALHKLIVSHLGRSTSTSTWAATKTEEAWANYGKEVWSRMLEVGRQVLELAYDSPGCGLHETPAESWAHRLQTLQTLSSEWRKESFNTNSMDAAVRGQLGAVFSHYVAVRAVLESEAAREKLVSEASRHIMIPKWLYKDLLVLDPSAALVISNTISHVDIAEATSVPAVLAEQVNSTLESVAERHTMMARIPGVIDSGHSLDITLFPMDDVVLSRVFYATVNLAVSPHSTQGQEIDVEPTDARSMANILTVMRYHGARQAIVKLLAPEQRSTKWIIAGKHAQMVDPAGRATYFDALGAFFYRMQAQRSDELEHVLSRPNVFGESPETAFGNNGHDNGRYASYVRGMAEATSCLEKIDSAEILLDKQQLMSTDSVAKASTARLVQTWTDVRASLWYAAMLQALEDKHLLSYNWFTMEFLPVFVALDKALAPNAPLFGGGFAPSAPSAPSGSSIIMNDSHYDLLAWTIETVKLNAQGANSTAEKTAANITLQQVADTLSKTRERLVEAQRSLDMAAVTAAPTSPPQANASIHDLINYDLASTGTHVHLLSNYLQTLSSEA